MYEVIEKFIDKEAGVDRKVGSTVDVVDEKRLSELLGDNQYKRPFIKLKPYDELSIKQLKLLLDKKAIRYNNRDKKEDLIALIN